MPDTPTTRPASPMASSMAIWVEDMQTIRPASPSSTCPPESLGCGLAVAGDEEGCLDTLGTLPRIRNGEQYALPAVGAFDVEARGVFGRID